MFEFNGQKLDMCLGDIQENCFLLAWNGLDISMSVFSSPLLLLSAYACHLFFLDLISTESIFLKV